MTDQLSPARIAAVLARQVFRSELVCPNCTWTGHEADLLIVHGSLRLIDVEIKISRADVRADIGKDKWWHYPPQPCRVGENSRAQRVRRDWPPKVWKHYFAMPAEIWRDDLLAAIPACSGVLTLYQNTPAHHRQVEYGVNTVRRAQPNREAKPIAAADAVNIARLTGLRYWDALAGKDSRWTNALAGT